MKSLTNAFWGFKHTNEIIWRFLLLIYYHRMTCFQDLEQCNKLNQLFLLHLQVIMLIDLFQNCSKCSNKKHGLISFVYKSCYCTIFFSWLGTLANPSLPSSYPHACFIKVLHLGTIKASCQLCYKHYIPHCEITINGEDL